MCHDCHHMQHYPVRGMKQDVDALRSLRCKHRMIGVPISGPSYTYRDNMSVVHCTSRPESALGKQSNSFSITQSRSQLLWARLFVGHITSKESIADLMMKVIYGQRRQYLVSNILYDIHDDYLPPITNILRTTIRQV